MSGKLICANFVKWVMPASYLGFWTVPTSSFRNIPAAALLPSCSPAGTLSQKSSPFHPPLVSNKHYKNLLYFQWGLPKPPKQCFNTKSPKTKPNAGKQRSHSLAMAFLKLLSTSCFFSQFKMLETLCSVQFFWERFNSGLWVVHVRYKDGERRLASWLGGAGVYWSDCGNGLGNWQG
jgi:hypothetical protein